MLENIIAGIITQGGRYMIKINHCIMDYNREIKDQEDELSGFEIDILRSLIQTHLLNQYENITRLHFELKLRNSIIEAAILLNRSDVTYATFKNSYCNSAYWILQNDGGFKLRPNVSPSTAIRDIYMNGSQYAFECATAMVIVYYKAVLHTIEEEQFNRIFSDILLWDWHYDKDLGITTLKTNQFVPGDVLYFSNPDVDPQTPEWQGENAVYLEKDTYYGHGIGIKSAPEMIAALNAHRAPNSQVSAYLLDQATRPNFQYLSQFEAYPTDNRLLPHISTNLSSYSMARIGSQIHINV
jgi:protein-glutamine gamma-glutamyltransferase